MRGLGHLLEANERTCMLTVFCTDAMFGAWVCQGFVIKQHNVNISMSTFSHFTVIVSLPSLLAHHVNEITLFANFPPSPFVLSCTSLFFDNRNDSSCNKTSLCQEMEINHGLGGQEGWKEGRPENSFPYAHTSQQTHVCAHDNTFFPSKLGSYQIVLYPFFKLKILYKHFLSSVNIPIKHV